MKVAGTKDKRNWIYVKTKMKISLTKKKKKQKTIYMMNET